MQTEKRLLPLQAQEAAVAELRGLWTEIGLPAQEVEQKLVAFSGELHAVLSNAVRAEEEGRTALHAEVPQLCEELRALCEVVEADHPALEAERDAEMLVVPRHRALKAGAEALRSLRAERLTQRSEREAKLGALLGELHADGAQPEGALAAPAVPGADQPNGLARGTLEQLDASVAAAEAERAMRAEHVAALGAETAQLRAELGEADEHAASPPVAITIAGIAEAEDGLNRLRAERARRLRTLMQASEYIAELCNKLKLSDDEIVTLPSPESGLSRKVMAQYTAELERLEAMKAEKIGLLLADARARLRPLWREMHMSEAETRAVTIAWDDADGVDGAADAEQLNKMEEMLWAVEAEERRLHEKIEATSKIFSLMGRREEILGQREEMRALANDPNRLFAKGRGAASARLREEKLRVAVEKDLPKMNRRLREIVGAYQASARRCCCGARRACGARRCCFGLALSASARGRRPTRARSSSSTACPCSRRSTGRRRPTCARRRRRRRARHRWQP